MCFPAFQHLTSRNVASGSKILAFKAYWIHLSKATRELGQSSGFTYGGLTLIFFTMSVLLSYGFAMELKNDFSYALLATSLLFQVIILSQCNGAQKAANQVRPYKAIYSHDGVRHPEAPGF
jgi:membrane protein required for beta-lactamase induction